MEIINPTIIDYSDYNKEPMEAFQANPIAFVSSFISGSDLTISIEGTAYTEKDNIKDSIIFGVAEANRLIDIEKELLRYENKYEIKSENFYLNWKSQPDLDQSDFNKWVDLYRLMQYAQK